MKTVLAMLIAALAVGCSEPARPAASDEPAADQTIERRWVEGQRHRYRFAWNVSTRAHDAWHIDGAAISAGIDLSGILDVHVLPASPEGQVLECSFADLDRHVLSSFGHDMLAGADAARQLVGYRAWLVIDPAGVHPPKVQLDPQSPSVFRHMMAGLLVHLDVAAPVHGERGTALVPVGHGLAEVAYVRDRALPGTWTRTIAKLARFDGILGDAPPVDTVAGLATITFDGHGLPAHVHASERVAVAGNATDQPDYASETSIMLERESVVILDDRHAPPPSELVVRELSAAPDETEARRELARRFAEDLTIDELEHGLASVGWGMRPERGFVVRATGLLRAEPDLADAVGEMFLGSVSARARLFALDMLTSAGTPEAQAVIVALLRQPDVMADEDYPFMLQRLALLPRPQPQTVGYAMDLHATAEDESIRNAIAYPLGSLAQRIAIDDPAAAAAVRQRLREHLQSAQDDRATVAALAGLGNAADPEDLELLLAHVDATSDAVRLQMASSLRRYDDPTARAAMRDLARDAEPAVAMLALSTLDTFGLPDADLPELGRMIIQGEISPEVTTSVINVLARHRDRSPDLEGALWVLLGRETDLHQRLRLERMLGVGA